MNQASDKSKLHGPHLVGVDGGGSKTQAVIGRRDIDGKIVVLSYGIAGPANIQTVSAQQAWDQCRLAIDRAFAELGGTPDELDAAAFAMAGEGSLPHRKAFIHEIERSGVVKRLVVTHDARPLIAGGTPDDWRLGIPLRRRRERLFPRHRRATGRGHGRRRPRRRNRIAPGTLRLDRRDRCP
jgi:hypothetical protein